MGDCLQVRKPPQFVTSHPGQLSLLPSAGRKMSTGQSAVTICGWGVNGSSYGKGRAFRRHRGNLFHVESDKDYFHFKKKYF